MKSKLLYSCVIAAMPLIDSAYTMPIFDDDYEDYSSYTRTVVNRNRDNDEGSSSSQSTSETQQQQQSSGSGADSSTTNPTNPTDQQGESSQTGQSSSDGSGQAGQSSSSQQSESGQSGQSSSSEQDESGPNSSSADTGESSQQQQQQQALSENGEGTSSSGSSSTGSSNTDSGQQTEGGIVTPEILQAQLNVIQNWQNSTENSLTDIIKAQDDAQTLLEELEQGKSALQVLVENQISDLATTQNGLSNLQAEYNVTKEELESVVGNLTALTESQEETKSDLQALKDEYSDTKAGLQNVSDDLSALQEEHDSTKATLQTTVDGLSALRQEYDVTKADLQTLTDDLAALRSEYASTTEENSQGVSNQLTALKGEQDATKEALQQTLADLATLREEYDGTKGDLQKTTADLAALREEFDDTKNKLQTIAHYDIPSLKDDASSAKSEITALKEMVASLEGAQMSANISELQSTSNTMQTNIAALRESVDSKADAVVVTALENRLRDGLARKTDYADFETLSNKVDSTLPKKADVSDLQNLESRTDTNLAKKADVSDLQALEAKVDAGLIKKADASSVKALEDQIQESLADKADDAELKELDQKVTSLQEGQDTATVNIAKLRKDLTALSASITDPSSTAATVAELNALKDTVFMGKADKQELMRLEMSYTSTVPALSASVSALQSSIGNKADALALSTLETKLEAKLDRLNDRIHDGLSQSVSTSGTALNQNITATNKALDGVRRDLEETRRQVSSHDTSILDVKNRLSIIETSRAGLDNLAELERRVDLKLDKKAEAATVSDLSARTTILEKDTATNTATVQRLEEKNIDQDNRITSLESTKANADDLARLRSDYEESKDNMNVAKSTVSEIHGEYTLVTNAFKAMQERFTKELTRIWTVIGKLSSELKIFLMDGPASTQEAAQTRIQELERMLEEAQNSFPSMADTDNTSSSSTSSGTTSNDSTDPNIPEAFFESDYAFFDDAYCGENEINIVNSISSFAESIEALLRISDTSLPDSSNVSALKINLAKIDTTGYLPSENTVAKWREFIASKKGNNPTLSINDGVRILAAIVNSVDSGELASTVETTKLLKDVASDIVTKYNTDNGEASSDEIPPEFFDEMYCSITELDINSSVSSFYDNIKDLLIVEEAGAEAYLSNNITKLGINLLNIETDGYSPSLESITELSAWQEIVTSKKGSSNYLSLNDGLKLLASFANAVISGTVTLSDSTAKWQAIQLLQNIAKDVVCQYDLAKNDD